MEVINNNTKMIADIIRLVFEKEITWETLEIILDDMTSTLVKAKQVIKILIQELKALDSKSQNEVIAKDISSPNINKDAFEIENIVSKSAIGDNQSEQNEEVVEELENEFYVFIGDKSKSNAIDANHDVNQSSSMDVPKITKVFECSTCFKKFTTKQSLKYHNNIHTREKPYQCETCSKSFAQLSTLKSHERTHAGKKSFKCKTCSKWFSTASICKKHENMHTGEKPYQCETCHKCFFSKHHLLIHERVHTGEKPYACKYCQKCFANESNLNRHILIHTVITQPLQCKSCSKIFTRKDNLKRHESMHTG